MLLAGCSEPVCALDLTVSGALTAQWNDSSMPECNSFGPLSQDAISLYWEEGFSLIRVRLDFVLPGDTGRFTDVFVSIEDRNEEWGSYGDDCEATISRHDRTIRTLTGDVYVIEGTASCDGPLTGSTGTKGELTFTEIQFQNNYQHLDSIGG